MKRSSAILVLLVIIFTTISIVSIAYFFYSAIAIKEYPMQVIVGNKLGIDVGTDMIRFGGVMPGGGSTRILALANNNNMEVRAKLLAYGELKGYVTFSDNNFIMMPNESRNIDISLGIPAAMPYGSYNGTMRAIFIRA